MTLKQLYENTKNTNKNYSIGQYALAIITVIGLYALWILLINCFWNSLCLKFGLPRLHYGEMLGLLFLGYLIRTFYTNLLISKGSSK